MNLIEIKSLSKSFGRRPVLANLDLGSPAGKHLQLTGPSGGGKSTLLRIIAGLEPPDSGVIALAGECATEARKILVPPHRRGVAMVFQDLGLWPNLTVAENVMLGLSGQKLSRMEKQERTRNAIAECGIESFAKTRPNRLSGGEQQRVAVARSLAVRPKLLLLDEPFSGLDIVLRHSLLETLQLLSIQHGLTAVLVSHHLADARLLGADIAVLEGGNICEQGPIQELLKQPKSRTLIAWREAHAG